MITRIVGSIVALIVYGIFNYLYNPIATLKTGEAAGRQFENNDGAYLESVYTQYLFSGIGMAITGALLLVLVLIWFKPVKDLFMKLKNASSVGALIICALVLGATLSPQDAHAFFEKTDRTEVVPILPNQSAFWIPDVGNNKKTQTKMDSEAYLNERKVSFKRFTIPHQKLEGSAGKAFYSGWDYYVPAGRLILVDRTPYSREWVNDKDRGTSTKSEGFPCQSKEGINIRVGVSIGTSVLEKNAAKFLFRFGVKAPEGKLTGDIKKDGEIIFTSVYHGRSLQEVMDDVGRKKVQTLVCSEIGKRTFLKANEEANEIMQAVHTAAKAYFEEVGVQLDFIGWGDSYEFDEDVQITVNQKLAAEVLESKLPILKKLAQLKVQEGLGKGMAERGLPIVVTPGMIEALLGLVKPNGTIVETPKEKPVLQKTE